MIGQTISHYKITDKLGAGGMGVVYKATDLKLERTVALKFLPADAAITDRDKQNLIREARASSALDHPNTGVIYGLEETDDHQLYIVMGYYEGETLAKKLSRGAIPVRESLDLAIQIAGGLSAAHARSIIHRDIKPSNIIITRDNVAKIVDFGLARVVATTSATQSLHISGTLPYMAPEQVLGETVDQRSDIWSLGVILVQMITATHPFLRENSAAMTFAILNQPPAGLEVMPSLLQPIAYRALSKKPEHRYLAATEMLADLESARAQLPAPGSPAAKEAPTLSNVFSSADLKEFVERASTPRWQTAAPQTSSSLKSIYIALGVLLLALSPFLFPAVRERLADLLTTRTENHVAVLPFDNIGNDADSEAVAQGLMDSLTSELSNLSAAQKSLWVVPASVVRSRKITDPSAAWHELGATLVVKGSIRRDGQGVHLTVNLIDAKGLRQIGSAALEDRAGDLAALQDEAVSRIARLMNINATAGLIHATGGSVAPAAFESYLKALGYMQRYDKPGNLDSAMNSVESALKTDPTFALGYAVLGETYRLKYQLEMNPKFIDEALANCQKALQLDNRLSSAYVTLGRIHERSGDHELALQEFQHALDLDHLNAEALSGLAHSYETAGRVSEAETTYQKVAAMRPDYWDGYDELGLFYDRQNKYPQAIAQIRRAVELTPDNAQAYSNLGAIYIDTDDPKFYPDAEMALKKSVELSPSYAAYANLGSLLFNERHYAEAAAMTEKALQLDGENYLVWIWLRDDYVWLKDSAKADAALERALQLLERDVKLRPRDGNVQAALATVYAKKNLRDQARTHLQTALALLPDNSDILEEAAQVSEIFGDRSQALDLVHKALKKGLSLDRLKNDPDMQRLISDSNFHPHGK